MHFVTSWDIPATVKNRELLESQLIACFSQFPHSKPLTTFYIIQVPAQTDYINIKTNLQNVGKTIPGGFRLVVSPVMSGGRYDGLLITDNWTEINKISG